ncbi:Serine/threonine-protein phosphatase PP1-gamma catalytic subunit [Hondaea fermentalgiana]|uniref:Serine/threonine-protein phosphatase n=1 Tax=Hondaea fermentalgiana TaxID=2315210 RepID=A0A2R5GB77_9STRA|nr:Serine/threonine-protein phosphatase PP1-gamma catalytic subunit [Hondaea fermentalgiana]|eukprot:GBG28266.1 Serine/threonine-protein phosphatase PP1-gamma catalytic subunit [Hondaea fermentalgiana]
MPKNAVGTADAAAGAPQQNSRNEEGNSTVAGAGAGSSHSRNNSSTSRGGRDVSRTGVGDFQPGANSAIGATPQRMPASPPPPLTNEETAMVDGVINSLLSARSCARAADLKVDLDASSIHKICARAEKIFLSEPGLLKLKAPINIVGDIHGQFLDLLRYFEIGGLPPNTQYLFLGDYVDRGKNGVETTMLLLAFKLKYPDKIYMLKGNHECTTISRMYGFWDECAVKYSETSWREMNAVFKTLPLAALVNDRIFATHGGLSPDLISLRDINAIERPSDVPIDGLLCDLLWSDPTKDSAVWMPSDRGVSYCFGERIVDDFLQAFDVDIIVRAHQVVPEGFEFFPANTRKLVTVFSAVNYCNQFDNAGAMMLVDKDLVCSFHVLKPETSEVPLAPRVNSFTRPQTPRPD